MTQSATQFYTMTLPFLMERGGVLDEVTLAFETWGVLNSKRDNAVLILTGLSPDAHAAANEANPDPGWWEPVIGPGKPIDTDHYFVVCMNSLGSCKGSTGPASINPDTGNPWRLDFPELSIEDIGQAAGYLLDHLRIERLHTLVGPSMGGMSSLAFLNHYPRRAKHFLTLSSCMAAEPFTIAIRSLQRETIIADRHFDNGRYSEESWPETGMRIARKLGMISYRSAEEWRERFGRQLQARYPTALHGMNFEVESYLEAAAERFVGQFDPVSYIYLSRAMDWFDLSQHARDSESVLSELRLDTACVIGVKSDILFPINQQRDIADLLEARGAEVSFHQLDSVQGHDAFLVDYDRFLPVIDAYMDAIGPNPQRDC